VTVRKATAPPDVGAGDARGVSWGVLVGTASTELVFNVVHATGRLESLLAVLYGVAPVATAIGLSHIVAACRGGWLMRTITVVIMLGAMGLSVGAVATVVAPAAPGLLRYLFPAVLNSAAMVALQVVLSPRPARAGSASGEGSTATTGPAPGANSGASKAATNVPAAPAPPVVAPRASTMLAGPATTARGADGPATMAGQPEARGPATTAAAGTAAAGARPARPGWSNGNRAPSAGREPPAPQAPHMPGTRPENISEARGRRGETRAVMRDFWDREIAAGNAPTGAALNRAAGKDPGYSLGKKYAAEWREENPAAAAAAGPAGGGTR
jgi:hypothetical protein